MAPKSYPISTSITKLALSPFIREVSGGENIPDGGYVLVANHSSFMDGVILASVFAWLRFRPLHMIGITKPFDHWLFGWMLKSGRSIPFDRSAKNGTETMMSKALSYLQMGEPVGLFPEGHMNDGRQMRKCRPGAALLALESRAKVLPVGICGSHEVLPMGKPFPKLKRIIKIRIGKPIDPNTGFLEYNNYSQSERVKATSALTKKIAMEIADLAGINPPG